MHHRSWAAARPSRSPARNLLIFFRVCSCNCFSRSVVSSRPASWIRKSRTRADTDVSACAARIRARRYTSSSTATVIFFTVPQYHSHPITPSLSFPEKASLHGYLLFAERCQSPSSLCVRFYSRLFVSIRGPYRLSECAICHLSSVICHALRSLRSCYKPVAKATIAG